MNITNKKKLIEIKNIYKYYNLKTLNFFTHATEKVKAVRGITLDIYKGEILGIVGESGCGKSTLARLIVKMETPHKGTVIFRGRDIFKEKNYRFLRKGVQLIFQDPFTTFSPTKEVGRHVADAFLAHKLVSNKKLRESVNDVFNTVGIDKNSYDSFPRGFSGGELQIVNIARAIAVQPEVIISDEGVSILDVAYQAKILNLIRNLQKKYNNTFVFITHDFSVVRHICDRIVVMYLGKIVEIGDNESIFKNQLHPYTKALIDAIPTIEKTTKKEKIVPIKGEVPSPIKLPSGCAFHPRCSMATELCEKEEPTLKNIGKGRYSACHYWDKVS